MEARLRLLHLGKPSLPCHGMCNVLRTLQWVVKLNVENLELLFWPFRFVIVCFSLCHLHGVSSFQPATTADASKS